MGQLEDYLYHKASIQKIPLNGTFELSPVCNFQCKMCYVRKTYTQIESEGKAIREWTEWLELAKQCKEAGMLYLLLTGGEPLIYPHFKELYMALCQMGFLISINTNGTMIDEQMVAWFKQYPPHRINITLYGASPETYARICGQASGYEKVITAIHLLKEAGITVVLNASMIPENEMDLEKIIQFGKDEDLLVRMATYMFPPARRESESTDSRFNPKEAAEIFMRKIKCQHSAEQVLSYCQQQLQNDESLDDESWGSDDEFMWCRAGRSSFWISWEGAMTACGMMTFPLAVYPFENAFAACWERLTNQVRTTPVLKGCSHCKDRKICRPCVAMIQTETGTPDEKSEYMCQMTTYTKQEFLKITGKDSDNGKEEK